MKKLFIKLIHLGNHHFTTENDIKNNVVANQLILIFITGMIIFWGYVSMAGIILFFQNDPNLLIYIAYLVPPSLAILGILILSFIWKYKTGNNLVSISIAFLSGISFLIYMSVLLGNRISVMPIYFNLVPVPFFVFNRSKFSVIILAEFILIAVIFGTHWYITNHEPIFSFPSIIVATSNYNVLLIATVIFATSAYYLWNETIITEEKVIRERQKTMEALESVKTLKIHQDGDYFLTSLLTSPLNSNNANSGTIETEIFLKSKKQFIFKGNQKELGGDLNILDNIILSGKKYIVFMNGDAMGKSLQGAGGALVLGSVFKSLIIRARIKKTEESYPELWLKDTFYELNQIFETFNFTMLASVVLGLVEEDTGFIYFINAEHPFLVIYRDGKAKQFNLK